MPIKISDNLPARRVLESENIFVMTENRALHQDIRPLRIVILNLMPTKITTETQILRCLSNTPLQIEVELLQTSTYKSKNTPEDHLLTFYKTFDEIKNKKYDGLIITGAPVELMEFEDVEYWSELCEIFEWSKTHVFNTLHICWGAQAGLFYHYGIPKFELSQKVSGVFKHTLTVKNHNLFRGFNDVFDAPHSRYTEVHAIDINNHPELEVMSISKDAGVYIVRDITNSNFFVMGHPEYDKDTLKGEYIRDVNKGINPNVPHNYFPENNPEFDPLVTWKSHAHLLYTNWLNYFVYQTTPYDIEKTELSRKH